MRLIGLILAFVASTVWAAPSVVASQFTAFNGNAPAVAIPAGAAGDLLVVFVATRCGANSSLSGLVSGWTVVVNTSGGCNYVVLKRDSDGTEGSVVVPLTVAVLGEALALRVDGADASGVIAGGSAQGYSNAPNAPILPVGGAPVDTLWLTFAVALELPTLAPSGYTNALSAGNAFTSGGPPSPFPLQTAYAALMVAQKASVASSEDAGAWVLAAARSWRAATIGIR